MIADAEAVAARMGELGVDCGLVAQRMRRDGLPGTTAHWVSMTRRGLWGTMPDAWLCALARALRCQPVELLGDRPRLVLVVSDGTRAVHR